MMKNKFVTYNFYQKDEKYYILQYNQHIEVSKEVFNAYKKSIYAQDYNDLLFHNNNLSMEHSITSVKKICAEQPSSTAEDNYIIKESNREFLMSFKPRIRQVIILWLEGYNDREVAEKIGVSRQYVCQIRAQLRKIFQ